MQQKWTEEQRLQVQGEACAALTVLAHSDVSALHICDNNAVYILATLLLPRAAPPPLSRVRSSYTNIVLSSVRAWQGREREWEREWERGIE